MCAEVSALASAFFADTDGLQPMSLTELQQAMAGDKHLTLIDVRPEKEFISGHVSGALNVPLAELAERMASLPKDTPIVAYCRGAYCVMAAAAIHQLREAGFGAARLEIGYPDWLTASGTVPGTAKEEGH